MNYVRRTAILSTFVAVILLGSLFSWSKVASADTEENMDEFEQQLLDWEEEGIDPNHTEVIENVRDYLDQHVDNEVFASLHIDRDDRDLGVIIISTTEPLAEEHMDAMRELAEEPAEIDFREVTYTEEELHEKQAEIDFNHFEDDGITIHHTGTNVIDNVVEVGIEPFNDENAQHIYDMYGEEMIQVIEGEQAVTLDAESAEITDEALENNYAAEESLSENEEDSLNFFQRIANWFRNLF